jgi:hypothetical protein
MSKKYIKVEPEKPDIGLQLLNEGLTKALKELPIADTESVASELSKIREGIESLVDQQRASQEASKARSDQLASAIASIELNVSESSSEPLDVQPIVEALKSIKLQPQEVPQIDVEGLVEKIFNLTNKEKPTPTYNFEIERNASGVLVGIKAIPIN